MTLPDPSHDASPAVDATLPLPHEVRPPFEVTIPMGDGCRLSARVWVPEGAEDDPVPAILEYIPYRKSDFTAHRDAVMHPFLAGHGYACVRVDMRGSGDSEGILLDEYLPQEQQDACDTLSWLAAQPWCDGSVGMIGKSWGGFNGLQVAAAQPPELGAVVTVCSTDDRYADDVHYMGGCVVGSEMLPWSATMLAHLARPPDPAVVGDEWRQRWLDRMERTPSYVHEWLAHQRRDAYWEHGSVCEDFSAVRCPVLAVGGWQDPYRNAVLRMLEGLAVPAKGLIGPWAHTYPHQGVPGPRIGFLRECLRWFDRWLKGIDTGVEADPALRVWMPHGPQEGAPTDDQDGRWVAEVEWPSERVADEALALDGDGVLRARSRAERKALVSTVQSLGTTAGTWCAFGRTADFPVDQGTDDGRSLTVTGEPLDDDLEILGHPRLRARVCSDQPCALLAVRLVDVDPAGRARLVSRGTLNLTHRDGHADPEPLEPGREYDVEVPLSAIAHRFPAGHRIRVALSSTYWPWVWPSPTPVRLSVALGQRTALLLPVRPQGEEVGAEPLKEADGAEPLDVTVVQPARTSRWLVHEPDSGKTTLEVADDPPVRTLIGAVDPMEESLHNHITFEITDDDPLSAAVTSRWTIGHRRGDWQVRVETESTMRCDASSFHVAERLVAYEGEACVQTRSWSSRIPRDLV